MTVWVALLDVVILLAVASAFGVVCERVRLSPLFGYLLAGTLLGPNALDLLPSHEAVAAIAELGVALLLFTIGLQFSWKRLRSVGPVALGGGSLQVGLTGLAATLVCVAIGFDPRASVALGAVIALSSTAAVLRLLEARAEVDAVHGRYAIGILLLQDVAVVPLVLLVALIGEGGSASDVGLGIARKVGLVGLLAVALFVLLNAVLPRLLGARVVSRYGDFPILLAVVTAAGATWLSHDLGLSPALGAFVAGMLLAESPFATRIRADIIPFRTLFVTLFFCSIGMLANPSWVADHWLVLIGATVAVVLGKTLITTGVVRAFGVPLGVSLATGLVLAQVGEFSLVIAALAQQVELIGVAEFDLVVALMMATLFLTPGLIAVAPRVGHAVSALSATTVRGQFEDGSATDRTWHDHIVLVGFGPAGQQVAQLSTGDAGHEILVVDLAARTARLAQDYGLESLIGDAARPEVLDRAHVVSAACVVVTIPDPWTARQIIQQVRSLAPAVPVVVRSRFHVHRWQLTMAGADAVVDEEYEVGRQIAAEVSRTLGLSE